MSPELHELHLQAGKLAGVEKTCGSKRSFSTEENAEKAALHHNQWKGRKHDVEPYPCYFCKQWHIGGIMPLEVLQKFVQST